MRWNCMQYSAREAQRKKVSLIEPPVVWLCPSTAKNNTCFRMRKLALKILWPGELKLLNQYVQHFHLYVLIQQLHGKSYCQVRMLQTSLPRQKLDLQSKPLHLSEEPSRISSNLYK